MTIKWQLIYSFAMQGNCRSTHTCWRHTAIPVCIDNHDHAWQYSCIHQLLPQLCFMAVMILRHRMHLCINHWPGVQLRIVIGWSAVKRWRFYWGRSSIGVPGIPHVLYEHCPKPGNSRCENSCILSKVELSCHKHAHYTPFAPGYNKERVNMHTKQCY